VNLYSLRNSAILDSGANIHVFNQLTRFQNFRAAPTGDYIATPDGEAPVLGYGEVDIEVRMRRAGRSDKVRVLRLPDVACCENFAVNLVSHRQLRRQGYWWDSHPDRDCIRQVRDNAVFCHLTDRLGQYVLEVLPENIDKSTFYARRNQFSSWTRRSPSRAPGRVWHLRLGHPGGKCLEKLVNRTTGVRLAAPQTWECPDCAKAKITRQPRREPRPPVTGPGERMGVDIHPFKKGIGGFSYLLMITDRFSLMSWDYYLIHKEGPGLISALRNFIDSLERQLQVSVKVLECDNEFDIKPLREVFEKRPYGLRLEVSAPNTQEQNGLAERSTRYINEKINAMRSSSKLPEDLWPEITRAAIYLANRSPRLRLGWKTPYEVFYSFLTKRQPLPVSDRRPDESHLRVYGCKAYAMTSAAQRKERRLERFEPKAWLGYLVGYNAASIYRIWVPKLGRVVSTRDVIFNEDEGFNGNLDDEDDDLFRMTVADLAALLVNIDARDESITVHTDPLITEESNAAELTEEASQALDSDGQGHHDLGTVNADDAGTPIEDEIVVADRPEIEIPEIDDADPGSSSGPEQSGKPSQTRLGPVTRSQTETLKTGHPGRSYPTPPDTPPMVLLATAIKSDPRESTGDLSLPCNPSLPAWKATFLAGHTCQIVGTYRGRQIDKAQRDRLVRRRGAKPSYQEPPAPQHTVKTPEDVARLLSQDRLRFKLRKELPPEPRWHSDLIPQFRNPKKSSATAKGPQKLTPPLHPFSKLFLQAEDDHLKSHQQMRSWIETEKSEAKGSQILDCMWVYHYKFDKRGRFNKCKARLVVRGDQQAVGSDETYAATLAGRSFRALIAIATRFDLELKQYDAVNAFVNASIDEEVYMRLPPGRRKNNRVLLLKKALYGLRKSPLLWQRHLSKTLTSLNCQMIPQDPCIFIQDGVLIFFYVDDIVIAFRKEQKSAAAHLMRGLESRYDLTGGDDLQWFTGIEVLRDRPNRKTWLSQSAYIDKINRFLAPSERTPTSPLGPDELMPHHGQATYFTINLYQQKIGSLLWAAVNTRPDVAFAVSRLGRHSHNPSHQHHEAADRVILYLKNHRTLGLQFGTSEGQDDLVIASDASFADNTLDRKSSQAYAIRLFGGLIMWSATKQNTVTTSTTEAELLALTQAAKEGYFMSRLLHALTIRFDDPRIRLQCDNQQTIRLVTAEVILLKTKLRHVDIHQHWLRQESAKGTLQVEYVPSNKIIADGFTKALQGTNFETFKTQLGLVDIADRLSQRREKELQDEDLEDMF